MEPWLAVSGTGAPAPPVHDIPAENIVTSAARRRDARPTGLPDAELVAFGRERLALHELLVRVTANVSVPDGSRIEDLGINFREMTR